MSGKLLTPRNADFEHHGWMDIMRNDALSPALQETLREMKTGPSPEQSHGTVFENRCDAGPEKGRIDRSGASCDSVHVEAPKIGQDDRHGCPNAG
jgi:hypothetical protein